MNELAREFCQDWPTDVYGPNDFSLFFEKGFTAGRQDALETAKILVEALNRIMSGLTTEQSKVERLTKQAAFEALEEFREATK